MNILLDYGVIILKPCPNRVFEMTPVIEINFSKNSRVKQQE